jgi:glycosyltransferase involved in cell wall biosynthesis
MKLVSAILVRNEATRYLPRVLAHLNTFSDTICVLDDRSVDDTVKVARAAGALVKERSILKDPAWGHEAPARAELWDFAAKEAGEDGWILVCDADMLLQGDVRSLCFTWDVNAWAFVLWDCWDGEDRARVDGPWQGGPATPRPWLFHVGRCLEGEAPLWNNRGLHCGHHPANVRGVVGVAPPDAFYWKHLAYLTREQRLKKHTQYLEKADHLTAFERIHAASIVDQ